MSDQTERHAPLTAACNLEQQYTDSDIVHVCRLHHIGADAHRCTCGLVWRHDTSEWKARALAAEAALDQLRAYARWCKDRSVEPDERDILNLADGKECHDYVALMRRQGAPSPVSAATGETGQEDPT
jgi:hypothetical protein